MWGWTLKKTKNLFFFSRESISHGLIMPGMIRPRNAGILSYCPVSCLTEKYVLSVLVCVGLWLIKNNKFSEVRSWYGKSPRRSEGDFPGHY